MKTIDIKVNSMIIRVQKSEFNGHKFVDVRKHYQDTQDEGEWKPTQKGIALPLDKVGQIVQAILLVHKQGGKSAKAKTKKSN